MGQYIPDITDDDITRIIHRDFQEALHLKVPQILSRYKGDNSRGRNRVYASVLKLSVGNIKLVEDYIEEAIIDYRDILASSEYPNYGKIVWNDKVSQAKKEKAIKKDKKQYLEWLEK